MHLHLCLAPCTPFSSHSLHRLSIATPPRRSPKIHQILSPGWQSAVTSSFVEGRKPQLQGVCEAQTMVDWKVASPMTWDAMALVAMFAISLACVKTFDVLRYKGYMSQKLSRKMVHITSGALFCMLWTLFSDAAYCRYLALLLPTIHFFKLLLVGMGVLKDTGLVSSITRENSQREVLGGPLMYVIVLFWVTYAYWRSSIIGFIAVSMMCGGDGLADIVGRRMGKHKWPHNKAKSVEGSFAMLAGGAFMSFGLLILHQSQGFLVLSPGTIPVVILSALAATIAESFANNDVIDDNLAVPLAAAGTAHLMQKVLL